jgi:hypothetical protein
MRHPLAGVLVGVLAAVAAAGFWSREAEASQVIDSGRALIVVRTFTESDSAGAIQAARRSASAILGVAGVDVGWVECGRTPEATVPSDACARPLRLNELVMRIVTIGDKERQPHTLGVAAVDLGTGGGSLATIYADRVRLMAQSAGIDTAELLGRAMAHEIGHLLLGTNRHASRGLMRAYWSSTDLRRSPATQWLFGVKEADLMRNRIATRLAAAS